MTVPAKLTRLMSDPRGPELVLPGLRAQELSDLINDLFRNLDTPSPLPGAETWYELAVEEDLRRSSTAGNTARDAG
jgi:hypothetical protein